MAIRWSHNKNNNDGTVKEILLLYINNIDTAHSVQYVEKRAIEMLNLPNEGVVGDGDWFKFSIMTSKYDYCNRLPHTDQGSPKVG